MNENIEPADAKLNALLRESRPSPDLPPGFQNTVWRRIERAENSAKTSASTWIERLAGLIVRPRWAFASLGVALLLGAAIGIAQGSHLSKQAAQERYIAAVSPLTVRQ
jgi:hypothetical protein